MRTFLLLFLVLLGSSQQVQIFPDQTYNQTTASSRACFANCQFCQIRTGFCEECLSPYFQKDVDGNCVPLAGYVIESSRQQLESSNAFIPSNVSWSTVRTTQCQSNPLYFSGSLKVLGPFSRSDGTITYRRSISSHRYMKLKFFFLKMGWNKNDKIRIIIQNQNNVVLSNETISYLDNIPKQQLCSGSVIDQRFSLSYDLQNPQSTSLYISFIPEFESASTRWAIGSFLLLTGQCHPSCDDCFPSLQATQCKNCRNFFIQGLDGTCTKCADGFRKITSNEGNTCEKCPIEYSSCQTENQVCFYASLSSQLNSNCTWSSAKNYVSDYYGNSLEFSGSLFSVGGSSSTYQCGQYSIIGLANRGQAITRIFPSVRSHQALSLTFNIFIVDQLLAERNIFDIFIDNVRVETLFVNTQGISSICAGPNKEVFQTYPATKFFSHTNQENVNITIVSANTANWGIRNLRVSYHVCDPSCLECGESGCITCPPYFFLQDLRCQACLVGASRTQFQSNTCFACPQNCLSCLIDQNTSQCTSCKEGFFLFQGLCQRLPNVGVGIYQSETAWESEGGIIANHTCSVNFKSQVVQNFETIDFLVAQSSLNNSYLVSPPHYKMLVSFYLVKIDNWLPNEQLHLYLNDLLVLKKSYGEFGNRICFEQTQNDFVSFEQLYLEDDNNTLTAEFEVVNTETGKLSSRLFGVSQFQVFPIGCEECDHYDFQYKIDYVYDQVLIVHVIFNRLYVNNNATLFKQIFELQVNGQKLNYVIAQNDSIRYFLEANLKEETILSNITVICKYPQKVTTDITVPINEEPFFQGRLMQENSISQTKYLENAESSIVLERYTPLQHPDGSDGVRIFFEVITRLVIYLGFFSFFFGCLTPCTHFMHNLQKIWVHIFVASLTIPNFLRVALKGFREAQDQNIAIHPSAWQAGIPEHLYYQAPAQYQQYYHDITFFRNIYSVGFAAALYLVFALVMYFLFSSQRFGTGSSSLLLRHLKVTFYSRPFFVFNSVIFYQYLTTCLSCTLQFIDLESNTNEDTFIGLNAAATLIAFILATVYPLVHFFYLSHKEKDMYSIDYEISYRNRYHEIFYRFLPENLWKVPNYEFRPIGFKQRFYNLLRFGQIWWICIVVTLMYDSPFAQAFLLLIMNFLHLMFIWISSISYTSTFRYLKVLELLFFVGLEILILVTYEQNQTLTTEAYRTLGIVGVIFICMILIFSLIRFVYTFVKIFQQYREEHIKENKLDERLRNDDFYASFVNPSQKVVSDD